VALKITAGPLPDDGTRIKVEDILESYVEGTALADIGLSALSNVTLVFSATDPPATSTRDRTTLWFERGRGRLQKWTIIPTPSDATSFSDIASGEGRWCEMSGDKRQYLLCVATTSGVTEGNILQAGNNTARRWAHMQSDDFRYIVTASRSELNIVCDPLSVLESNATGAAANYVQASSEWGFIQGRVVGPSSARFLHVHDTLETTATDAQGVFIATSYSEAGISSAICAFAAESASTDGEHTIEIFFRPDMTNILHGEQ